MGCEAQPEVCGTPGGKNRIGGRRSAWLQHKESGKRDPAGSVEGDWNQIVPSSRAQEESVSRGPQGTGRPARRFQAGEN